ncbi:MAG: 30S ribosomal protein S4 [Patescibacteria group bacterium]
MRIGPRYKIARRLGPGIFDKTQTQKFAVSQSRKEEGGKKSKRPGTGTQFAVQMLEKQKARYTYGVGERQFKGYAKTALSQRKVSPASHLYERLECRLDNVIYRLGLVRSRQAARQMVNHGHLMINGTKTDIPSFQVSIGDKIRIRDGSAKKPLFKDVDEMIKKAGVPTWIKFDATKREWEIVGVPTYNSTSSVFDLSSVIEFYSR